MAYTRAGQPFAAPSDTSYEAAIQARAFVAEQGMAVYRWLKQQAKGGTQKEAAAALNIGRPSVCARFKGLEDAMAIRKTSARRGKCTVYEVCGAVPSQLGLW